MNPDISCLLLDITKEPVNIIGMIAAYTTWKRIQIKEIEHGNRIPMIPNSKRGDGKRGDGSFVSIPLFI